MFNLFTASKAIILIYPIIVQALSQLTILGLSDDGGLPILIDPDESYDIIFNTTGDNPNNQWAAVLVLDYVSPVFGSRPLMPVCLLAGGQETSTIGSTAIDDSIDFVLTLRNLALPSTVTAGIEVGELTSDGISLISIPISFNGSRAALTSAEAAGLPVSTVAMSCEEYAASINVTAGTCTGGSGPDNTADLCNFACTNGFCSSPCTCTSMGVGTGPIASDPDITGFAAPGLDATTFDSLCNFACARGFCPNSTCTAFETITPPSGLEAIGDLEPFDISVSYVAGDILTYPYPFDSGFGLGLSLLGMEEAWDDVDCGVTAAPGPAGDSLGCVASEVEYLFNAVEQGTVDELEFSKRDTAPSTIDFQIHPNWKPDGDCTAHCQLVNGAPPNNWILMGNGTHNGVPHEVHFFYNDDLIGHRVIPNPVHVNASKISARLSGFGSGLDPGTVSDTEYWAYYMANADSIRAQQNLFQAASRGMGQQIPAFMGQSVSYGAANTRFKSYCPIIQANGSVSDASLLIFGQSGDLYPTLENISGELNACGGVVELPLHHVVWPSDRTDTDKVQQLLESIGGGLTQYNSAVDGLVWWWMLDLTAAEAVEVAAEPGVLQVVLECTANCVQVEDLTTTPAVVSATNKRKRDLGDAVRPNTNPDLAFISQSPHGAQGTAGEYVYDETLGAESLVYVIDSAFNLAHVEFTDSTGLQTPSYAGYIPDLQSRVLAASATPGQAVTLTPDAPPISAAEVTKDHGTGMLDALGGFAAGVAPNVIPLLYQISLHADPAYDIKTLDIVLNDWLIRKDSEEVQTPMAVACLAWGAVDIPILEGYRSALSQSLGFYVKQGILPVAAAGNLNSSPLSGAGLLEIPAALANPADPEFVPGLISAGAVDNSGNTLDFSTIVTSWSLFAPGTMEDLATVPPDSTGITTDTYFASGSSIAAAKLSGLGAYLVGLSSRWIDGQFPGIAPTFVPGEEPNGNVLALQNLITELAYPRVAGQMSSIWNGASVATDNTLSSADSLSSAELKNLTLQSLNSTTLQSISNLTLEDLNNTLSQSLNDTISQSLSKPTLKGLNNATVLDLNTTSQQSPSDTTLQSLNNTSSQSLRNPAPKELNNTKVQDLNNTSSLSLSNPTLNDLKNTTVQGLNTTTLQSFNNTSSQRSNHTTKIRALRGERHRVINRQFEIRTLDP